MLQVRNVVQLLESTSHNAYPVIERDGERVGMTLIALVTRRQLCLILANGCYGDSSASYDDTPRTSTRTWLDLASAYPHYPTIEQVKAGLSLVSRHIRAIPTTTRSPWTSLADC